MPLKDTIQTTVKSEITGVTVLGKQAIQSGTYLYPLRGAAYFFAHRSLWRPLAERLAPLLSLSVGVIVPMFLFTYIPQAFFLQFVNGPLAWITTATLVLSESAAIITALARTFIIDEALVDIFDMVLISEKQTELVKNGREMRTSSGGSLELGKLLKRPFAKFTPAAIIRYLMWLPLNFVPIVGTVLFILVQGRQQGPTYHARYFQLKSYTLQQKLAFIELNNPKYLAFGAVCMLLQLVPGASILFLYTNTVGAALWAVEMEKQGLTPHGEDKSGMELSERVQDGKKTSNGESRKDL